MENKVTLKKAVNDIIKDKGTGIFEDPSEFRRLLCEQGISRNSAITIELMLSACPALANALSGGTVSRMEANSLVSIIVQETSLSPSIVRKILGELLMGRGADPSEYRVAGELKNDIYIGEKLSENLKKKGYQWSLINESEERDVLRARRMLFEERECDSALSELDRMAEEGNAEANYAIGEYYLSSREENAYERARKYMELSAKLGYGPAFGALAEMEIHSDKGSLEKAAQYLEHPLSLKGRDGRSWSSANEWMLNYQHSNTWRAKRVLALSLIALIVSSFSAAVRPISGWAACILAVICIARSSFCIFRNQYQSLVPESLLLTALWFLLITALL